MAATTGQLGLVTPTQGDLSGTWGNTVNNGITEYTNIAIAATLTLTNDGAVTLANTTGDASASNIVSSLTGAGTVTAQFAIVRVTGTLTTTKVVTFGSSGSAPYSKTYLVVNAATGGSVSFTAYGGSGVTVAVGESAYVYYNGTNIVKVAGTVDTGVTSFTAGTTGLTPSTATTGAVTLAGTLATTNGGTGLTSFTSGGVVYASSTSALATGSALTFDGTNLSVTSPSTATTFTLADNGGRLVVLKNSLGAGGNAEVGTTTNHDFYVRAGAGAAGVNSLYLQAGGVTGYSLSYAGLHTWFVGAAEKMRLDTSGNLGIGTSSPAAKLHVVGENAIIDRSGGDPYLAFYTSGSTTNVNIYGGSSTGFRVFTGGSERLRVDTSGNLGLGVTPSAWVSTSKAIQLGTIGFLENDTNSSYYMGRNGYRASGSWIYSTTSSAQLFGLSGGGDFTWYTAPSGTAGNPITFTQAMTLDASGNLGIGTSSPSSYATDARNLVIASSGNTGMTIKSGATSTGIISFANAENSTSNNGIVSFNHNDLSLNFNIYGTGRSYRFQSAGTEVMRLDSAGNLGINENTPAFKLDISSGSASSSGAVTTLRLKNPGTSAGDGARLLFTSGTSTTGGCAIAGYGVALNSADMLFYAGGNTERMRLLASGGFSVGTTADPGAGAIYATGNITAYYSDKRLKTVSGKIENALDKVAQLSGVYYTNNSVAKSFGYDSDEVQVGVLAQDVEAVLPQIVKAAPFDLDQDGNSKSGENYKTVQYEKLIPLLIEAINELQAKVKALESK